MSDIAIRVEGLSKAYRIGLKEQRHETLASAAISYLRSPISNFRNLRKLSRFDDVKAEDRSKIAAHRLPSSNSHLPSPGEAAPSPISQLPSPTSQSDVFWALRDVSFEVKHGEVLGIIGRNGAGKSTLLKILSRITEPTSGRAMIYGRVASLLEVGTGFHPDLTGRENIYLNGTILGMRKREIDGKFDEIVDFSGVEKFIDTPVKRYSSGMRVRLAFAVAAHLDPEILIIDEVLAVGDAEFQKKCLGKMQDVATQGRTVLFVSHNMAAVSALCSRSILLENGSLKSEGSTDAIIRAYRAGVEPTSDLGLRKDRDGNGALRFTSVDLLDAQGLATMEPATGQPLRIRLGYEAADGTRISNVDAAVLVRGQLGELLFVCIAGVRRGVFSELPPQGSLTCEIPKLPLPPGSYQLDLWAQVGSEMADRVESAARLEVGSGDYYGTGRLPANKHRAVLVDYNWQAQ